MPQFEVRGTPLLIATGRRSARAIQLRHVRGDEIDVLHVQDGKRPNKRLFEVGVHSDLLGNNRKQSTIQVSPASQIWAMCRRGRQQHGPPYKGVIEATLIGER